jgi:hypothetical protein
MKHLLILFSVMAFTIGQGQNKKHRESFNLRMKADSDKFYSLEVPQSDYFVKDKVLQIYPSETLLIEAEISGDSIVSMKVVEKNAHPEKTIIVLMDQIVTGKKIVTILNVKNPFNRKLHYDAALATPKNKEWKSTGTYSARANRESHESWPFAIIMLQLDKWRFD